jgi:hypothetical protein
VNDAENSLDRLSDSFLDRPAGQALGDRIYSGFVTHLQTLQNILQCAFGTLVHQRQRIKILDPYDAGQQTKKQQETAERQPYFETERTENLGVHSGISISSGIFITSRLKALLAVRFCNSCKNLLQNEDKQGKNGYSYDNNRLFKILSVSGFINNRRRSCIIPTHSFTVDFNLSGGADAFSRQDAINKQHRQRLINVRMDFPVAGSQTDSGKLLIKSLLNSKL